MPPRFSWTLLRTSSLVAASLSLAACGGSSNVGTGPPPTPTEFVFASGTSQVSALSVDTTTGALTVTGAVQLSENTTGVVVTPSASFLYLTENYNGVDGYSISPSGALSAISGSPWLGPENSYEGGLAVDPSGKFLYAAALASPELAGFTIDKSSGALTAIAGSPFSVGTGPTQPVIDQSGRFLYVSDILDPQGGILGFSINPTSGVLTPLSGSPFPTLPQAEPSGLVSVPSGKFLYAALSNDYSIAAFAIDPASGALTTVPGSPFVIGAAASTGYIFGPIATDPSGNFLYVLSINSSGSSISVFAIDPSSGVLTPTNGSPFFVAIGITGGLAVDSSGKFLYIAGGDTSAILALSIDGATGAVTPLPGLSLIPDFPINLTTAVVK